MRITRNHMNNLFRRSSRGNNTTLLQSALARTGAGSKRSRLSGQSSRTSALGGLNPTNTVNAQKLYYNMKYHAGQVCDYADKLNVKCEEQLYEKARADGSTEEIIAAVKGFVNHYNSMMANMKESGGRSDVNYQIQFNSLAGRNSSALASTGVTRNADGTLTVDEKKLGQTDVDTLEKVWGGSASFAGRAALQADSVERYAERSMEAKASSAYSSLFNGYGSKGNYFNFFS